MSEDIRKYLDQDALKQLIKEIKYADSATLHSATEYCDAKDNLFEKAGAGATAEANANKYTDDAIAPLATTEKVTEVEGKITTEENRAKAEEERIVGLVNTIEDKADANAEAIEAINDETNGILAQAKAYAESQASIVQENVDGLAEYIGEIPVVEGETTPETIVAYIQKKTSGIATSDNLSEFTGRVEQAEKDIDAIEADYLKNSDKTELSNAIAGEKSRAEGIESGLRTDIDAVKADYLKGSDKTDLSNAISEEAETARAAEKANADAIKAIVDDYLKAEDKEELQGSIDDNADAIAAIKEDVDAFFKDADIAENAKQTLKDIQTYITEHTSDAAEMVSSIEANTRAIDEHLESDHDFASADTALKSELKDLIDAKVAQDDFDLVEERVEAVEGDIETLQSEMDAVEALAAANQTAIAGKAAQSDLETAVAGLEEADAGMLEKIEALEDLFGEGEGSVSDQISDAVNTVKQEAADDATQKANAAEANAKAEATRLNGLMNTRVEALEAVDHEHANKALLDTYTQTEANLADAVAKKHEHENESILNGISADKVSVWDASEQNAKTYADGLNTAMTTKVDALSGVVDTKASEEDLETLGEDVADNTKAIEANAKAIAENKAAIETFVPYTDAEIAAMFKLNFD